MGRLRRNVTALMLAQAATLFLPLLSMPFLSRALGPESFGAVILSSSVIAYLSIIIDWGFSLGAVGEVARRGDDEGSLRAFFWQVNSARLILLGVVLTLGVIIALITRGEVARLLVIGVPTFFAAALGIEWFFQGTGRMVHLAAIAIVTRIIATAPVFFLVRAPQDGWIVIALNSFSALVSTGCMWLIARRIWPFVTSYSSVPLRLSARLLWDDRALFVARMSITIYTGSAAIALGAVASVSDAGLYGGAERLSRAPLMFMNQINAVFYPQIASSVKGDPVGAAMSARRLLLIQVFTGGAASVALAVGSSVLVRYALGPAYHASAPVLLILAALPLLIGASGAISTALLSLGFARLISRVTIAVAVMYVPVLLVLAKVWGANGAAIALVAAEIVVLLLVGRVALREALPFVRLSCRPHRAT